MVEITGRRKVFVPIARVTSIANGQVISTGLIDLRRFTQRGQENRVIAEMLGRKVTLYLGPPNSGKTHAAFERLQQALDGAYLAPLRLLALEGRDRLVGRGVPCSLLTGEENVPADGARVVSSTIEMVGTSKPIDVAVIDEAQMIFDPSRGWAWTQAIVAVPANEVIIICSAYAVPAIENLLGLCGERCTVRHFDRKQHVDLLPQPVPISALKLGDAVVAFSRRDVLTRDRRTDAHSWQPALTQLTRLTRG
jgi:ATP-dependent RNA helicase SUPV3L1/SUV3